jgi:lipoprotein-anchoring transpeptidase ErfK/SrfK
MHRYAFPTLVTTVFTIGSAIAAPIDLSPQASPGGAPAAPPSARYAQAQGSNLGGGFFEMLFRGPGSAPQRPQYQPDPYQPPSAAPGYRNWQYETDDGYVAAPSRASLHPSRTEVDPRFQRQEVSYNGKEAPGTVIINTRERLLYLVQANGRALRYGIGVGRPGFTWAGTHRISQKREWPDWRPPKEMLKRQPNLPRHMRGGPENPLGARAMYLGSTLYRIHGSNEPWTIGQAVSSGCIRMRNEDVIHLYNQVKVGTKVVVI